MSLKRMRFVYIISGGYIERQRTRFSAVSYISSMSTLLQMAEFTITSLAALEKKTEMIKSLLTALQHKKSLNWVRPLLIQTKRLMGSVSVVNLQVLLHLMDVPSMNSSCLKTVQRVEAVLSLLFSQHCGSKPGSVWK